MEQGWPGPLRVWRETAKRDHYKQAAVRSWRLGASRPSMADQERLHPALDPQS